MSLNKIIIAIDPGANGAVVYLPLDNVIQVYKMPTTTKDIADLLAEFAEYAKNNSYKIVVIVEKVGGYMPGNSGPASVKFARHCGVLDGILAALEVPHEYIAPGKWIREVMGAWPVVWKSLKVTEQKKRRKNAIKAKMQQLYPDIKVTLINADALGILTWQLNRSKNHG